METHPITLHDDHVLHCPKCGYGNLHQDDVVVFNRTEDAKYGTTTYVSADGTAKQSKILRGNPSPRRQGMAVSFLCEHCDANLELLIYQHKGLTVVRWISQEPTPIQSARHWV